MRTWLTLDTPTISQEVLVLIAEIDEFKGAWRALGSLAPERLTALRRVATIESVGSSTRIEGSRLSDIEVERLLANLRIQTFATRDEQEVAGYASVMETVFAHSAAIDFSENHIRQLHRDLLAFSTKDARRRGHYKTAPNNVAAFDADGRQVAVVFETATPFETPRLMTELVDWTRRHLHERSLHPLLVIAVFTVVFLAIHPFQDGNGRLSRVLTTLLLLRSGYTYVPYGSLESVIESSKEGYYLALRQTQGTLRHETPYWEPWLRFFLRALQRQKARLEARLARERILLDTVPEPAIRIVELTRERGRVTIGELVALSGVNRNTLKKHLKELVASRHLRLHGAGKGAWYGLEAGPPTVRPPTDSTDG